MEIRCDSWINICKNQGNPLRFLQNIHVKPGARVAIVERIREDHTCRGCTKSRTTPPLLHAPPSPRAFVPSGEKATDHTLSVCPSSRRSSAQLSGAPPTAHTRTELSYDPLATSRAGKTMEIHGDSVKNMYNRRQKGKFAAAHVYSARKLCGAMVA